MATLAQSIGTSLLWQLSINEIWSVIYGLAVWTILRGFRGVSLGSLRSIYISDLIEPIYVQGQKESDGKAFPSDGDMIALTGSTHS